VSRGREERGKERKEVEGRSEEEKERRRRRIREIILGSAGGTTFS
jgi:hypothetical protein